jgi:predicted HD phosphohydrolase
LAERAPDDTELQLAGLTHDLGHVLAGAHDGADLHGEAGARFVAALLGPDVARLVELHVPAKRYLVATDPGYGEVLSDGSSISLATQGGPMHPDEVAAFERDPLAGRAAVLRRADEAAKDPGAPTTSLDDWRSVVEDWIG